MAHVFIRQRQGWPLRTRLESVFFSFCLFFDGASVESNLGRHVDVLGMMSASELRRMRRGLFSHMRMCTMEEGNTTTHRVSVSCEF